MSKALKIVLKIIAVIFMLFTGTFIIYFFNLDMKLTSLIEPFLLKQGLITRTPKGRMATRKAYEHLGRAWTGD